MRPQRKTFDKEKVNFNLVKFESHGLTFELVVDANLAIAYKENNKDNKQELRTLLKAETVFHDAKKGEPASEMALEKVFNTTKTYDIAQQMLEKGEIQLTKEHREKLRERKRNKIVNKIHRLSINPQTNTPHPERRIINAMNQANVHIDEFKSAKDQLEKVLDAIKPILPIRIENRILEIGLNMDHGSKLYGTIKNYGTIKQEKWHGSGLTVQIEIPAGITDTIMEELKNKTKGKAEIKIIKN